MEKGDYFDQRTTISLINVLKKEETEMFSNKIEYEEI